MTLMLIWTILFGETVDITQNYFIEEHKSATLCTIIIKRIYTCLLDDNAKNLIFPIYETLGGRFEVQLQKVAPSQLPH